MGFFSVFILSTGCNDESHQTAANQEVIVNDMTLSQFISFMEAHPNINDVRVANDFGDCDESPINCGESQAQCTPPCSRLNI